MTKLLTDNENRVLACLRENIEGGVDRLVDGTEWGHTYLDNALPFGMSIREFDGTLGSLKKKGFYKFTGEDFGTVKL